MHLHKCAYAQAMDLCIHSALAFWKDRDLAHSWLIMSRKLLVSQVSTSNSGTGARYCCYVTIKLVSTTASGCHLICRSHAAKICMPTRAAMSAQIVSTHSHCQPYMHSMQLLHISTSSQIYHPRPTLGLHSCLHSLSKVTMRSLTHSLAHSLAHSLTHSLIH